MPALLCRAGGWTGQGAGPSPRWLDVGRRAWHWPPVGTAADRVLPASLGRAAAFTATRNDNDPRDRGAHLGGGARRRVGKPARPIHERLPGVKTSSTISFSRFLTQPPAARARTSCAQRPAMLHLIPAVVVALAVAVAVVVSFFSSVHRRLALSGSAIHLLLTACSPALTTCTGYTISSGAGAQILRGPSA